ncbi:GNAT family N-acetyltransferase [Lysinibacillus sphaericus]|uniref:N-acetyltransferase GCN5 n=1 Tax=Lysinibacillus sphaericus OT4b.31 TaxID=1285586 RepID=R7ZCT6_LYSSH|nr:GNAT family N-acetyltransferase [Lysinibacillus sphaericus]EON71816.1 N-acetyltransferase GCN5 [Lysinibacillus sphaericus OT4b.31]
MKVRTASIEDAQAIARVHVDSWKSTYVNIIPQSYLEHLSYEKRENLWQQNILNEYVFVAENDSGEIIGFCSGGKNQNDEYSDFEGALSSIYLIENYQGKGIGKQLVQTIIQCLRNSGMNSMLVFALADNPSKYFYEKLGASFINSIDIKIANRKLIEHVYGWEDLKSSSTYFKDLR